MRWFERVFHEFIDVIEWLDDSNDTLVFRFERYGNAIKYGAKLIVRESQIAVFVNEGQVADVLGPGTWELETKNLPVLTTLQHWHHGFESPFKAEVYFCNTRRFTDLKWGTRQPIMLRDTEFGALRIRAFGSFSVRIGEPLAFIREIVGTDGVFTTDEILGQLRNLIGSRFAGIVAGAGVPVLDMAASYDRFGEFLQARIAPEFEEYGLELVRLLIENISLPESVNEALDRRTSLDLTGDLDRFVKYQSGQALEGAASSGGSAGEGIGLGVGMAMGRQLADALSGQSPRSSDSASSRGGSTDTAGGLDASTRRDHANTANGAPESGASPPPLPSSPRFHIAHDGAPAGPFALDELARRVADGTVVAETLVWRDGMDDWAPAGEVELVAALLPSRVPPPLPGT